VTYFLHIFTYRLDASSTAERLFGYADWAMRGIAPRLSGFNLKILAFSATVAVRTKCTTASRAWLHSEFRALFDGLMMIVASC
jgi:hypothetical protein